MTETTSAAPAADGAVLLSDLLSDLLAFPATPESVGSAILAARVETQWLRAFSALEDWGRQFEGGPRDRRDADGGLFYALASSACVLVALSRLSWMPADARVTAEAMRDALYAWAGYEPGPASAPWEVSAYLRLASELSPLETVSLSWH